MHIELAVTNKRVTGTTGGFNTDAMDAALNKIQNVMVAQSLWEKSLTTVESK